MVKPILSRQSDGDLFEDEPDPVKGWIIAHCDGGSRGNPGPSGFGVLVQDKNGAVLGELSEFLGKRTNNYAEYAGLLAALNFAVAHGYPRLRVVSDSELMVKQIKGQYRVNSPELKPLHEEARHRIALLEGFEIEHVLREKNRRADELANRAMDRGMNGGRDRAVAHGTTQESGPVGETPAHPHTRQLPDPRPRRVQPAPAATAAPTAAHGSTHRSTAAPPIPISRPASSASSRASSESVRVTHQQAPEKVRGFVKGGVVHLLDGAHLPDGVFVWIIPDDQSS